MFYRLTATVILITGLAFVTACSVKTLYNQLDYLIPEYVTGMVTLDDIQEIELEQRTALLLKWHRHTELKLYSEWLRGVQKDVKSTLTEEKVLLRIIELDQFWHSLMVKVNDDMAQVLPKLNQQQQDELFASLAHKNEKFREEYVDLEQDELIESYRERLQDNFESWIGELTKAQALRVKQAAQQLVSTAELRLQHRLSWQFGIQKILARPGTPNSKAEQLRKFLTGFEKINNQAMKGNSELNRNIIASLTVYISSSMTKEQKVHFMDKTNDYIRMLTELAENR